MITPKYYSQNGEDYLLWKFFDEKRSGFYVDIGAFDGIHLSNTFTFEQMGWNGICVEANPEIFNLCKGNRPNSICLNAVCIGERQKGQEKITFFVEETGLLSSIYRHQEKIADLEQRYRKRGLTFSGLKAIEVNARSIHEILTQYSPTVPKIDFMSLDTEGNELDIIQEIDFETYDIRVLVVEFDKTDEQAMCDLLSQKGGYLYARRTLHNLVFVKSPEDQEKMNSIPITCVIEKQLHPKGITFTPPIFRNGKVIKDGRMLNV